MKHNWMKQGLLVAALGVLPTAIAWSQTVMEPDAEEQRDGETAQPRENAGRGGGRGNRPAPGQRGRGGRGGERRDENHEHGQRREHEPGDHVRGGDERTGPRRGDRRGPGFHSPGGPQRRGGGGFENHRGPRGGGAERGRGRGGRGGPQRGGHYGPRRDGEGFRMGYPSDYYYGRDDMRRDDTPRYSGIDRLTLRGTVTSVVADNSIGLRAADGNSFWVQLPESNTARLRVGQEVELSGQWRNQSFVAHSVRVR